jgi:HEAT repeat protein
LLSSTEYQRAVRLQAVLALAQIGPRARSAVPTLVKNAQDNSSWQVRKAVCFALGRIGADPSKGPDPSALGTLLTCCKDAAGPVRFEAILALSALGLSPRPTEVVQEKKALVSLLNDPDKNIAIWARVLLMFLDESYLTPKSLVYLTNFLKKDSDPKIRSAAARAIGTLGPKAKSLIPDLFDALNDKELDVILNALSALGMMIEVSPTVLPELESRLNDSEVAVRAHVAGVLGHVGEPAKAAVPKLTAALRDKEVGVVYQVIVALTRMGPPAAPALATLDDLAKNHKDESIRQAAEEAAKIIRELAAKKKP